MCGESKLLARPKEPLGRIVLIPLVTIAIIHRELVVEVVISLSHCDERRDHAIFRSEFVVIWLVTKPVTQGVDAERGLGTIRNRLDASS
jgi:hypothetical protein